jgi:glycosyltransferase A (GT-A) superfamily protein (DUF2064 family)
LRAGAHAVLGPSTDGGYWLIGARGEVPDLFTGIPWSTREVLTSTLARADDRGIRLGLVPFWYDVDEPSDVRFLAFHLDYTSAPYTARALKALRARNPGFFSGGTGT